jgi:hypothetical protein
MNNKRLDKLELELTPKQWALKLAYEMRRYPSQEDFMRGVAKGSYRQSPFARPFFALKEQAREHSSKRDPKERVSEEFKLNCKLRKEFHALKHLINSVNDQTKANSRTNREKTAVRLFKLQSLILQDVLSRSAGTQHVSASSARLRHSAGLKDCGDCLAVLWIETSAYNTAVRIIQERYFESQPILFNDIEMASDTVIRTVQDAIELFNEYCELRADLSNRKARKKLPKGEATGAAPFERDSALRTETKEIKERTEILAQFLVHKWAGEATFRGTADILEESGQHEDFIWARFRHDVGLEPSATD